MADNNFNNTVLTDMKDYGESLSRLGPHRTEVHYGDCNHLVRSHVSSNGKNMVVAVINPFGGLRGGFASLDNE